MIFFSFYATSGTLTKLLGDLSDLLSQMKHKAKLVKNFDLKVPPTQNYVDTGSTFWNTLRENLAELSCVSEAAFSPDSDLVKAQALVDTMQSHIDGLKHAVKRAKLLLEDP